MSTFSDGRVSFSILDDQIEIKYQHLNPATYFQEVVEMARSVVLAGGTMSPVGIPTFGIRVVVGLSMKWGLPCLNS